MQVRGVASASRADAADFLPAADMLPHTRFPILQVGIERLHDGTIRHLMRENHDIPPFRRGFSAVDDQSARRSIHRQSEVGVLPADAVEILARVVSVAFGVHGAKGLRIVKHRPIRRPAGPLKTIHHRRFHKFFRPQENQPIEQRLLRRAFEYSFLRRCPCCRPCRRIKIQSRRDKSRHQKEVEEFAHRGHFTERRHDGSHGSPGNPFIQD